MMMVRRIGLFVLSVVVGCSGEVDGAEEGEDAGAGEDLATASDGEADATGGRDSTADGDAMDGESSTAAEQEGESTGGAPGVDSSTSASSEGGSTGEAECVPRLGEAVAAFAPIDVIFAIDGSGSMSLEMNTIEGALPGFFESLHATGDTRLALLVPAPGGDGPVSLCVDPPYGSGGCPFEDDNPPDFLHPDVEVASNATLSGVLDTHEDWAAMVRDDAAGHLVVISDDDSALTSRSFLESWSALDTTPGSLTVHAWVASDDPVDACLAGTACCSLSAAQGDNLSQLANETEGVVADLCDLDAEGFFGEVLDRIAADAAPPCTFALPDGVDLGEVVVLVAGVGIPRVDDVEACADLGWYVDGPGRFALCPASCGGGPVTLELGCPPS